MKKAILIVGATGYLGRAVFARLRADTTLQVTGAARYVAQDPKLIMLDAKNIAALNSVKLGKNDERFDVVINATATIGEREPIIVRNLLNIAQSCRATLFIHISSIAVYRRRHGLIDENSLTGSQLSTPYARMKQRDEACILSQAGTNMRIAIMRPGCMIGNASPRWETTLLRAMADGSLGYLGKSGDHPAPLVHVEDVAEAIWWVTTCTQPHLIIQNLVSPERISWNQYLEGLAVSAELGPAFTGANMNINIRLAKAILQRRLGWLRGCPHNFTPGLWRDITNHAQIVTRHTAPLGSACWTQHAAVVSPPRRLSG